LMERLKKKHPEKQYYKKGKKEVKWPTVKQPRRSQYH